MPRHLISDAHEWINEIPIVPIYYLAKPQPRERAWQNQRGKKTLSKKLNGVENSDEPLLVQRLQHTMGCRGRDNLVRGSLCVAGNPVASFLSREGAAVKRGKVSVLLLKSGLKVRA